MGRLLARLWCRLFGHSDAHLTINTVGLPAGQVEVWRLCGRCGACRGKKLSVAVPAEDAEDVIGRAIDVIVARALAQGGTVTRYSGDPEQESRL